MGRLVLPPDPLLFEILYEPALLEDRQTVLPYLLRIDAAHILMLSSRNLLASSISAKLLAFQRELVERMRGGEMLFDSTKPHRGLYWLYEQQYIQRLGSEVGGAAT